MLEVFAESGFTVTRSLEARRLPRRRSRPRRPSGSLRRARRGASGTRRRRASASLLEPRSVAVVGASRAARDDRRRARSTNLAARRLPRADLPGQPGARARSRACRAYPDASARSAQPVDLAVDRRPRRGASRSVVADCARAGVRGVVVISAGFAEVSADGARRAAAARATSCAAPACAWSARTAWASSTPIPPCR